MGWRVVRRMAAVIAGVALGAAVMLPFGPPSRAASVKGLVSNSNYRHYDYTLLNRYEREQIGYETLRRLWLGFPPTQACQRQLDLRLIPAV